MMTKPKRLFRNRPTGNLESKATRLAIADAVHRAVCEYTESDGMGSCHKYAVAGRGLLWYLGKRTIIQAGTMFCLANTVYQDYMTFLGQNWRQGELHVWLADERDTIDFSSRLYRRMWEELTGVQVTDWNRPDPPPYVWAEHLPNWLILTALPEPTMEVGQYNEDWEELIRLAIKEYVKCRQ
jgi:hypothetical protein